MIASPRGRFGCAALAAAVVGAAPLDAAITPPVDRVEFAPTIGASLPLDARFVDEHGRALRLGALLASRPAIVVPAYFGCANLCGVALHAVAAAIAGTGLQPGQDVDVIVVSIEPFDRPADALAKERSILGDASRGWHFLTGDRQDIARFAAALGYRYAYVAAEHQYAHAAGAAIVAQGGRIVRVMGGVSFVPTDLRDAIATASAAHEVSGWSQRAMTAWLLCFHFDPRTGRYSLAAMNAVRVAALLALSALGGYLAYAWRRDRGPRKGPR